ncbi:MAG: Omp28-related outer membrane protein [Tannerella sp.]|jgi:hypothetical protein|nr:Omp28-related outer membrane protein [Tannerella sp.]
MKKFTKSFLYLLLSVSAVCVWNCKDEKDEPTPPKPDTPTPPAEVIVKLSADKQSVKANGVDSLVVTITADDDTVVPEVVVISKSETNNIDTLKELIFREKEAGKYILYAMYKGEAKDSVSVSVEPIIVTLSADKALIKANGKDIVRLSVEADGVDVTSLSTVTVADVDSTVLDSLAFATKHPSIYTFTATYDGITSNQISVEATEVVLLLQADKQTIKANASEKATLKVTADGVDVTSSSTLYRKKGDGANKIADTPVFFTDEAGNYTFTAIYDGDTTNAIAVEATYVDLVFFKQYLIWEFTSTTCDICPRLMPVIRELQAGLPGRIHRVALHMGGKHCTSALAGALGPVANALSNDDFFPSETVDLRWVEGLYPTTTKKHIQEQIDASAKNRDAAETGMAIDSKISGTDINFTIRVKSNTQRNYSFFAFIVEDEVVHTQFVEVEDDGDDDPNNNYIIDRNYIHYDVATYVTEGEPRTGVSLGMVVPGQETVKTFTIHTAEINAKREVNLQNCRIVGYTIRPDGVLDNVIDCPVGESLYYQYNK